MRSTRRQFYLAGGLALGAGIAGVGAAVTSNDARQGGEEEPRALVAGSLLPLAADVPGAQVEAHGSVAVRQLVATGARDPDVVALADPPLFAGIATEPTLFATNALTVAYDPDSRHADALEADWRTALQRPEIRVGRTDPETDPLGYRTVLALDLAVERGLLDEAEPILSNTTVFPETQLMRVLEGGKLDAAFAYRNMAVERDLPTVGLPSSIDFSDPALAESYATVSLDLDGGRVRGRPIRYAVASFSDRGRSWQAALTGDTARLREHGFGVPSQYPTTTTVE